MTLYRDREGPIATMNESDVMKARTEVTNVPRLMGGLDGAGWAAAVRKDPMRTLPPGAGSLVVAYYNAILAPACAVIELGNERLLVDGLPLELSWLSRAEWDVLSQMALLARVK